MYESPFIANCVYKFKPVFRVILFWRFSFISKIAPNLNYQLILFKIVERNVQSHKILTATINVNKRHTLATNNTYKNIWVYGWANPPIFSIHSANYISNRLCFMIMI